MSPVTAAAVPAVTTPRRTISSKPSLTLNRKSASTRLWNIGCAAWIRGIPDCTDATWLSCSVASSAVVEVSGLVLVASSALITAVPASDRADCRRYWTEVVLSLTAVVGKTGYSHLWSYPNGTPSRRIGLRSVSTVPADQVNDLYSSQPTRAVRFSKKPRSAYR